MIKDAPDSLLPATISNKAKALLGMRRHTRLVQQVRCTLLSLCAQIVRPDNMWVCVLLLYGQLAASLLAAAL
jgi:hypothetical protein